MHCYSPSQAKQCDHRLQCHKQDNNLILNGLSEKPILNRWGKAVSCPLPIPLPIPLPMPLVVNADCGHGWRVMKGHDFKNNVAVKNRNIKIDRSTN